MDSLHARCNREFSLKNEVEADLTIPTSAALAVTVGLVGLCSFLCSAARPGTAVLLNGRQDNGQARLEMVFRPVEPNVSPANQSVLMPGWPPPSLALAAEALGGHYAMGNDGEDTMVAVLVLPCR